MIYLLAALAVYRLSRMIADEYGPFNVFLKLRTAAKHYARGRADNWLWKGVTCPLCLSFWLAWPVAALLPSADWPTYIVTALALSGAATWLYKQERP